MPLRQYLDEYVRNKSWYRYVPFWLFGLYLFIKLLDFKLTEPAPSFFIMIAQSLDFFLHEMAHLLAAFLPDIVTAAAGSGIELLLGIGLIVTALLTRSYFAALFCGLWFMLACYATADYMADARAQQLPLVSFGGGDPIHDWHFIFSRLGLLEHDKLIAGLVRGTGMLVALGLLAFSTWLMLRMMLEHRRVADQTNKEELADKLAEHKAKHHKNPTGTQIGPYPTATRGSLGAPDTAEDTRTGVK